MPISETAPVEPINRKAVDLFGGMEGVLQRAKKVCGNTLSEKKVREIQALEELLDLDSGSLYGSEPTLDIIPRLVQALKIKWDLILEAPDLDQANVKEEWEVEMNRSPFVAIAPSDKGTGEVTFSLVAYVKMRAIEELNL